MNLGHTRVVDRFANSWITVENCAKKAGPTIVPIWSFRSPCAHGKLPFSIITRGHNSGPKFNLVFSFSFPSFLCLTSHYLSNYGLMGYS